MSNKRGIIQVRRGTSSEWSNSEPQPGGEILKLGEPGYEKDTGKLKIGDGVTPWNNLPYFNNGAAINPEELQDLLGGGFLVAGAGISIEYDDLNNSLTISNNKPGVNAAVEWTPYHSYIEGDNKSRYLEGDLVYKNGNLYRAKADNESQPVTNTTYWENLGSGYRLNIDGRDIPNIPNPFNQDLNTFNATSFDTVAITGSQIFGGGENSGDGNGYGTIELVPDSGLYNNDQYLIVDPTSPNHIHLRAGGNQDDSSAELIVGGELAHISITDYNHQVSIKTSYENPTITSVQLFSIYDLSTFVGSNCVPINSVANIDGIDYTVVSCSSTEYEGEFLIGVTPTISIESIDQSVDFVDSGVQGSYGWNFQNDGNLSIPGNILLSNVASVASGTYDNGTGGNGGISLNCSVGYQLNWQGSHLKNTEIGDSTNASRTIYVDSPLQFPGSGVANVQVSSSGIVFSDGTSQTTAAVGGGGNPFDQNLNTSDDPTFTNLNLDNSEKIVLPNNTIVWIGSVIETGIGPSYDPVFFFPEGGANGYYDLQTGYLVGSNVGGVECNNIFISSIEEYTYNDIFGYKFVLGNNCALEAWSNPTWHLTNPTFYSPNGQNVNINFTTKLNSTGSIVRDNNSGDGNNKGTFKIIPDNSLLNNDQYLVVDPTAPNHIHLRSGGTQDNSTAELIIGGEYAHLRVNDYNHNISIRASSGGNIQQFNLGGAANHYCDGGEDVVSSSNIPIPLGSTFEYDNIVYTVNSLLNYDSENGVYCYDTSPTLPGETLYGGGKIVGTFDLTLPYSTKDYTFGNDGVLQLASGGIKFSDNSIISSASGLGGNPFNQNLNTNDSPSFTDLTIQKLNINSRYIEKLTNLTISSNTLTIDLSSGNLFVCSLNSNINTLNIINTPSNSDIAIGFTIIFTADGTPRSVVWPGSIKWPDATAPNLTSTSNKIDVLSFITTNNGTSWLGFVGGQNY